MDFSVLYLGWFSSVGVTGCQAVPFRKQGEDPRLPALEPPPALGTGGSDALREDVRDELEFREQRRCYVADFQDGGRSPEQRNARNAALESVRGKERDFLLEPPEGMQAC